MEMAIAARSPFFSIHFRRIDDAYPMLRLEQELFDQRAASHGSFFSMHFLSSKKGIVKYRR
jgi:hypothetical protein